MNDIFEQTHTIAFELSNTCQLAWFHKACPLNRTVETPYRVLAPIHLPAKIVYDTLTVLQRYDYAGAINFHQYNEPLIDPRLFRFIAAARNACPLAKIDIISNGLNLSEQLARELKEEGVSGIWVTRYGDIDDRNATMDWMQKVIAPIFDGNANILPWESLDHRITLYEREYSDLSDRCYAPLCSIVITRTGDVGLCCYDWMRSVTFGNLADKPLDEIIKSGKMQDVFNNLQNGNRRILDVCRRCRFVISPCG